MMYPEVLLNTTIIKFKFNKIFNMVKEAFKKSADKKVFLSESQWLTIFNQSKLCRDGFNKIFKKRPDDHQLVVLQEVINVFTWAFTKRVYKFSDELFQELYDDGRKPENIKLSRLYNLPDWCAWVDVPVFIEQGIINGFFVRILKDSATDDEEQVYSIILTMYIQLGKNNYRPVTILFTPDTANHDTFKVTFDLTPDVRAIFSSMSDEEIFEKLGSAICGFLNVTSFICKDDVDLENPTKKPTIDNLNNGYSKATNTPFLAKHVNVKDVSQAKSYLGSGGLKKVSSPKCPHLRSGFERIFWTGSGRTVPIKKWVNSVFVNSDKIK